MAPTPVAGYLIKVSTGNRGQQEGLSGRNTNQEPRGRVPLLMTHRYNLAGCPGDKNKWEWMKQLKEDAVTDGY